MNVTEQHALTLEPQPMADQWMGKCSCGWRTTVSIYEAPTREATIQEIRRRHAEHTVELVKEGD